ncbi:MAG: methylated-DNA-protein-cysteine methyltransferase-like protein [Pseudomonadales bacterium]|jgi:methylated-DNA-protein-cysteine methyltransferase-like protein
MNDQDLQAIYLVINSIPQGKVATYGQIATIASLPGKARMVGNILSRLPQGSTIPWHRVINAAGKISLPEGSGAYEVQQRRLKQEGIEFNGSRIKLKIYQWVN